MNKRQRKKRNKKIIGEMMKDLSSITPNLLFRFDDHWGNGDQYLKYTEECADRYGFKPVESDYDGHVFRTTLVPKIEIIDIIIEGDK